MPWSLRSFAFSTAALLVACSGDDQPSTAALSEAGTDAKVPASDGASSSTLDADASVTANAGDTSNTSDTGDTSVTVNADAGVVLIDGEGGAQDVKGSDSEGGAATDGDAGSEAGLDATADAPDETTASDAPLDVDVSGGTILLLGSGAPTVFTGEFHPGSPWSASTLSGATDDRPAVALTSSSSGLGVIRSKNSGGELRFTSWSPGRFGAFAAVGSGATATGAPALAASATRVDLAYHATDLKHYFASYAGTWNPTAEPIGVGLAQSFGPTPASIALLGANSVVAFADNGDLLTDRSRVGGIWQVAHTHDLGDAGAGVAVTPTIVAPTSGPELLIAFVRSPDQDVFFTTRTAGTWAAPQAIDGAFTADPVALLALGGGDVILVLRSVDSHGYWVRYSAGVWSALMGFPWFDIAVPSTPSVASGITGADAEIAFVDAANGSAMHARLSGSTWSAPVTVGGSSLTSVSIASAP